MKDTYNPLLIFLLIVASFFIGTLTQKIIYLEKNQKDNVLSATDNPNLPPAVSPQPEKIDVKVGSLPLLGKDEAKVTIIEFSDLQCPFCRRFFVDTFQQLKKEYIDQGLVKLSFRHFPLSFHPMAQKSAEAAECANEQGKFWQFHDKIYEEQEKQGQGTISYTLDDIKQWAQDLEVEASQFNDCLDTDKYANKVQEDTQAGAAAGVNGTPGFFINGKPLVGAQPFASFKAIIDAEL